MTKAFQIRKAIIPINDLDGVGALDEWLNYPGDLAAVLAILSGESENGPKLVSLTPDGSIRTADTGKGFTHMEIYEGTIENNNVIISFVNLIASLVINIDAFQCTIEHSEDGVIYETPFTVLANEKVSMDIVTRKIRITNTSAVTATGYRVWGLYHD